MALAAQRGRPIVVQQKALPMPGPLGFWIDHKLADIIVVQERTTKLHQDHIVLHELCHLKADVSEATPWESLVSGSEADDGHQLFQRCSYDDTEECRVEKAATIIMEWASVLEQVGPPPAADPSVRRVNLALGDRQGWL